MSCILRNRLNYFDSLKIYYNGEIFCQNRNPIHSMDSNSLFEFSVFLLPQI